MNRAVLTLFVALVLFAIALPAAARERPNAPVVPSMPICDPGDDCSSNPPPPPPPCCDPTPVSHDPIELVFESGIIDEGGSYRELTRSGCKTVTNYVAGKELLFGLQTLFKHALRTHWCWYRNTITSVDWKCGIIDLTSTEVREKTPCIINDWPYMFNNNPNGGRVVQGTGYYEQCFIDLVCYREFTLDVTTYLHGDGTYTRAQ